jgi:PBP1b-binding outer membrane lipoprotein LpoB
MGKIYIRYRNRIKSHTFVKENIMKKTVSVLVVILSVVLVVGCSKKETPKAPSPSAAQKQAANTAGQVAQTAQDAAQTAKEAVQSVAQEVKQTFTADIDLNKTVDALKAEAEKMDADSLKQVALKYKDAIASKQGEIKAIADKLTAIPMTQKLGAEAQKLTADTAKLTESLKALTERFNVYFNALKAKGGDVSGLTL